MFGYWSSKSTSSPIATWTFFAWKLRGLNAEGFRLEVLAEVFRSGRDLRVDDLREEDLRGGMITMRKNRCFETQYG